MLSVGVDGIPTVPVPPLPLPLAEVLDLVVSADDLACGSLMLSPEKQFKPLPLEGMSGFIFS